ncbi:AMP-binding protein [Paenibacillus azoreducens]|uniref:AMP-binding protein n=1 Tax=Paenibacillus azoreducens TaxID=116718 RepID=UPI0039F57B2E
MNLTLSLVRHAVQHPDKIALSDNQTSLTYCTLVQRMKKIAQGLKRDGLNDDKVAILSANRTEFVEVFLGAVYAGCVPVPIDPQWSKAEMNAILQLCQPGMIFTETEPAKNLDIQERDIRILSFSDEEEAGSYDDWLTALQPEAEMDDGNELLFIGFTSGTTGKPKGYMRTQLSWMTSFEATNEAFQLDSMDHIAAPGPFVHSLSLFALMQSLYNGGTFHIVRHFDAGTVLELCKQTPDMNLFVVPTMIESMIQQAIPGQTPIQALISSGGKWPEASKRKCREVFGGVKLYEYYGSSEASYISYMDVIAENKPDSVGRPFSGVEVSIRDEHFREVPAGTIGQLYIRSGMMFSGYYHLPEETAAAFQDGWLKLGDYAFLDSDGYLYMAGRSRNMMVSGGLNVFPEEVESVLQQIPAIREVVVLGVPDAYWGERITAIVKWSGEQQLTLDEIKNYCRRFLASYKAPKRLITVDQFIYTSSGKIARHAMKEYVNRGMI